MLAKSDTSFYFYVHVYKYIFLPDKNITRVALNPKEFFILVLHSTMFYF